MPSWASFQCILGELFGFLKCCEEIAGCYGKLLVTLRFCMTWARGVLTWRVHVTFSRDVGISTPDSNEFCELCRFIEWFVIRCIIGSRPIF